MRIVRTGWWLYDGTVRKPVDIIGLPYDFWFSLAEADGQLDPGERPLERGDDGLLYYVRHARAGDTETPAWPESGAHPTEELARRAAEERVPGTITWD